MSTKIKSGVDLKALAKEYLEIWNSEKYSKDTQKEDTIQALVKEYPDNSDFEGVRKKVRMLNSYYSTRMSDASTESAAERIYNIKDFDKRVKKGDIQLVLEIATPSEKNENKGFVFATKYCVLHQPEKYVIYDSFVNDVLKLCRNEKLISGYKGYVSNDFFEDITRYGDYMNAIKELKEKCGLDSFRDLDMFLWLYKKENKL